MFSDTSMGVLIRSSAEPVEKQIDTSFWVVCLNDNVSFEDDYCVPFFHLKFLIPALCHMFCSPKPSNIYE